LLPGAIFVLPVLHGSFTPASEGAGWALIAAIPSALLLLWRGVELRVSTLWLFLVTLGVALFGAVGAADSFEAARAIATLLVALVALTSGAVFGAAGSTLFVHGLCLCSVGWILGAVLDHGIDPTRAFSGVLENTGDLSEAALPGALAGIVLLADRKSSLPSRTLGLLGSAAYGVYVGLVPVYAGAAAFLSVCGAVVLLSQLRTAARYRGRLALLACVPVAISLAMRPWLPPPDTAEAPPAVGEVATAKAGEFGGFEVRKRVWARVPGLVLDHPFFGVGPGQFERAFPPYRDPLEIELSTQHHQVPSPVDVEHAHNDWLEAVAEYGLVGGGSLLLFLLMVLARALHSLGAADSTRAAAGAAALGVLVNAVFNSPLLANPAASVLSFALFGILLGEAGPSRGRWSRGRLLALLVLALCLRHLGQSLSLARHGRALSDLGRVPRVESEGVVSQRAGDVAPILERALVARPDSVVALSKQAQLLRRLGAPLEDRIELLGRILAARPHRIEALVDLGNELARDRRFTAARGLYEHAAELDPGHRILAWNRVKLAVQEGRLDHLEAALTAGPAAFEDGKLSEGAAEALLMGRPDLARPLLMRLGEGWIPASGQEALASSQRAGRAGFPLLADAFQCTAHQLFARSHAEAGRAHDAVRSYRAALSFSRSKLAGGGRSLRWEFAAALLGDGAPEEARAAASGLELEAAERGSLPAWALQGLTDGGLVSSAP
jgi:O-antigen ligase